MGGACLKDPGKMPWQKISLLTALAVILAPSCGSVTAPGAITPRLSFQSCMSMPAHVDLDLNMPKMRCFPPPSAHLRESAPYQPPLSSRARPRSANQTGEIELESSLAIQRGGRLEQVHESRPKRNSSDFKYTHL